MAEMWHLKSLLLLVVVTICVMACTVAGGMPLVTAITKDRSTKLYSMSAPASRNGVPTNQMVLDLSSPHIWTNCSADHITGFGDTASDGTRQVTTYANATDGKHPLYVVSLELTVSCAPVSMFASLPAGAIGVVGLARSVLALPAQVADTQKVANKFALCLSSAGGDPGVAIFGGGPLFLLPPGSRDVMGLLDETPLHKHGESPGYYILAKKGIAVNGVEVSLDGAAPLLVGLSSTTPYTALRTDVYRAFIKAFDAATAGMAKVTPAVAPFELCYDSTKMWATRMGYAVPQIDLMLDLDRSMNWTVFGRNSITQVNAHTACLAFVEMKGEGEEVNDDRTPYLEMKGEGQQAVYGGGTEGPAVMIGGFQMEDSLLVFDEENQRLGFSSLLWGRRTTCSNFDFASMYRQ